MRLSYSFIYLLISIYSTKRKWFLTNGGFCLHFPAVNVLNLTLRILSIDTIVMLLHAFKISNSVWWLLLDTVTTILQYSLRHEQCYDPYRFHFFAEFVIYLIYWYIFRMDGMMEMQQLLQTRFSRSYNNILLSCWQRSRYFANVRLQLYSFDHRYSCMHELAVHSFFIWFSWIDVVDRKLYPYFLQIVSALYCCLDNHVQVIYTVHYDSHPTERDIFFIEYSCKKDR